MVIAFAVGSFESGTFFRIIDVCVTAVYIYRQVVYRAAEKQQFFPFSIRHVYYGPEGNKSLPKVCIIYFFSARGGLPQHHHSQQNQHFFQNSHQDKSHKKPGGSTGAASAAAADNLHMSYETNFNPDHQNGTRLVFFNSYN